MNPQVKFATLLFIFVPCCSVEVVRKSALLKEEPALLRSEARQKLTTQSVEVLPGGSLELAPIRFPVQNQTKNVLKERGNVSNLLKKQVPMYHPAPALPVTTNVLRSLPSQVAAQTVAPTATAEEKFEAAKNSDDYDSLDPSQTAWPDHLDVKPPPQGAPSPSSGHSDPDQWKKYIPAQDGHEPTADAKSVSESVGDTLIRLGMGVGPIVYSRSPGAQQDMNHELRQRLATQDRATVVILIFVLSMAVFVSCLGVYQFADDPSLVAFYSDPKYNHQRLLCSSVDMDNFLEAFNSPPQNTVLRIRGRHSGPPRRSWFSRDLQADGRRWGRWLLLPNRRPLLDESIIFDSSLDLTTFLSGDSDFASDEDVTKLEQHILTDNPLEILVLRKKVIWDNWIDVATNIRQKLRSEGFQGEIQLAFDRQEDMRIYRNNRWQNFVRMPITHILAVLSCLGVFAWIPYIYSRSKVVVVETHFHVEMDVERYWEMLAEGLSVQDGFTMQDQTSMNN